MNILISNDDGINAQGIRRLTDTLSQYGDVYVCAPHTQRSASSHCISINGSMDVRTVEYAGARLAMEITGTPADCVKLGIYLLRKQGIEIDVVYSGINHGSNTGTDTLYSGTVAAAIEGSVCGCPAVAVSVDSHEATHFDYACELAAKVLPYAYSQLSADMILNINTPNLPAEEIKGTVVTTLGKREYNKWFIESVNDDGSISYRYAGDPRYYDGLSTATDVGAMQQGFASITPMHHDFTAGDYVVPLEEWRSHDE